MVTLFCLSHFWKILWWIWCEIMLLKFVTVHLSLCWRYILDTAISLSVPSPLNVGVCKVNQSSTPQTLFQSWNYIIPLFPVLYWYFSREDLHIHFFKPSSLLRHAACFSQTTGCSIDWHCFQLLQGVTAALAVVPLPFSHPLSTTDVAAVVGGSWVDSQLLHSVVPVR